MANYTICQLEFAGLLDGRYRRKGSRALRYNPSLRAERGNLLNKVLLKLAKPGFPLQSLTQIELRITIFDLRFTTKSYSFFCELFG
jgi:hypothetical protein